MKENTTPKKTTKTELQNAVDSFWYRMEWLTGGTPEETRRQAPTAITDLEQLAAKVSALLVNLSKPAAKYSNRSGRATEIPARLEMYRSRYIAA